MEKITELYKLTTASKDDEEWAEKRLERMEQMEKGLCTFFTDSLAAARDLKKLQETRTEELRLKLCGELAAGDFWRVDHADIKHELIFTDRHVAVDLAKRFQKRGCPASVRLYVPSHEDVDCIDLDVDVNAETWISAMKRSRKRNREQEELIMRHAKKAKFGSDDEEDDDEDDEEEDD